MKITSSFTTGIISKLLRTVICQKLGYNVNVTLNELAVSFEGTETRVHLNMDVALSKEELTKILANYGL